jgi:excisionase family DNA binding protein
MGHSTLAYSVPEVCEIANAGRTSIYEAINTGALRAVKRGRRTLILEEDLRQWLQSLPQIKAKAGVKSESRYFGKHDRGGRQEEALTGKPHHRGNLP